MRDLDPMGLLEANGEEDKTVQGISYLIKA